MGVQKSYWVMRLPKPFLTSSRTEPTAKMSHLQLLLLWKSNHRLKNAQKVSKADGEQRQRGAPQLLQSFPRILHRGDKRGNVRVCSPRSHAAPGFCSGKKFQPFGKLSRNRRKTNNRARKSKTMQMCRSVYFQTTNFRHSPTMCQLTKARSR